MNRRGFYSCAILILIGVLLGGVIVSQKNASAYFKTNKDGNYQCFSIEYEKNEIHNDPTGMTEKITVTNTYSTDQVCAHIKSNGAIDGNIARKDRPKDTSSMSHPKIKVGSNTVTLYTCGSGGKWCGSASEKSQTFKAGDYATFEALAKAVQAAAPATYNNNSDIKKLALTDNQTKTSAAKAAQEKYKDDVHSTAENSLGNRCAGSGGALSLGWVVCPIMEWLSDAADNIYDEFVEPSLRVEPKLFTDTDSSVEQAWDTFRNFANIVFVILLLFIIFSQLTGVGIDNYGIKKTLPKLIVAAILINLSYLICLLAVDVSNILGNSFQALFNGFADGLSPQDITVNAGDGASASFSPAAITGITSVGLLALIVGTGAAIFANPAILLSLLVSAIGVVIAIFFLFILLAAREAAIVVLIVISPLAVVAYALPNTKKLFDRWWKIFEGLLLVYPICGLLVGGGDYISKLLLSSGMAQAGFVTAFTAILTGIVPIFFIPMVLKNSFAAMGNLGARITSFGQRVGGTATGMARNSQMYKNAQELGLERKTRLQAGVDAKGNPIKMGRFATMLSGGKRNVARSRAQYLRNQDARQREDSLMGVGYDAAMIAQTKRAEAEEMGNYMTLINDATRNGEDEDKLFQMFDQYMADGNKAGVVAVTRIAGRRKDTAARFAQTKVTNAGSGMGRGVAAGYDPKMAQAVAKEMATGENSGVYRASSPLAFEFAGQMNTGGTQDYNSWLGKTDEGGKHTNISNALEHHVTNSQELVGMKGGSLDEVADLMQSGQVDSDTAARISTLATQTIENRDKPGAAWDSTKAEQLAKISGQYTYDKATDTLTRIGGSGSGEGGGAPSGGTPGGGAGGGGPVRGGGVPSGYVERDSGLVVPH